MNSQYSLGHNILLWRHMQDNILIQWIVFLCRALLTTHINEVMISICCNLQITRPECCWIIYSAQNMYCLYMFKSFTSKQWCKQMFLVDHTNKKNKTKYVLKKTSKQRPYDLLYARTRSAKWRLYDLLYAKYDMFSRIQQTNKDRCY